jgi:hypothetical protein
MIVGIHAIYIIPSSDINPSTRKRVLGIFPIYYVYHFTSSS